MIYALERRDLVASDVIGSWLRGLAGRYSLPFAD